MRRQIDELLDEYTDARVAARAQRARTAHRHWRSIQHANRVQWVRFSAKLPSLKQRLLAAGMLTSKQMTDKLGVSRTTIGRWRLEGRIQARMCNDAGEWLYWPPDPAESPRRKTSSDGKVTPTA